MLVEAVRAYLLSYGGDFMLPLSMSLGTLILFDLYFTLFYSSNLCSGLLSWLLNLTPEKAVLWSQIYMGF